VRRGTIATTLSAAYALVALRTARRALDGTLALYGNTTPDRAVGRTPIDPPETAIPAGAVASVPGAALPPAAPSATPMKLRGARGPFAHRITALIDAEARLLLDHLTDDRGRAFGGYDARTGAPVDEDDALDAHAAAIRGLYAAYLATGDTAYRDRAAIVFERMDAVFFDPVARIYVATPAPADTVEYTPLRFALVQAALRDTYELVAARTGAESLATRIQARLARLDKLVLNGWDDRNDDGLVDYPDECILAEDGLPRGGLQMAERTLTGETGSADDRVASPLPRVATRDRDQDCVPEIDDARLPAALARSFRFTVVR
jgi:hypothetical protein